MFEAASLNFLAQYVCDRNSEYTFDEAKRCVRYCLEDILEWNSIQIQASQFLILETEKPILESCIAQLCDNIPVQHILGKWPFHAIEVFTSSAALIPRPETEELVEWILNSHNSNLNSLVDIGTGTACIPIAIQFARPNWTIQAVDISESALELAKRNIEAYQFKIQLFQDSILNPKQLNEYGKSNIWVSNPPYIPVQERSLMLKRVENSEPELALFVPNQDPLVFYRVISEAAKLYKPEFVYFELHEDLKDMYTGLWQTLGFEFEFKTDLQGKTRMARIWLS